MPSDSAEPSGRRVLVTGLTGYIGRYVGGAFVKAGWTVHGIVRQQSTKTTAYKTHLYDGTRASLIRALTSSKPDVVVHLASAVVIDHNADSIESILESNIRFPALLIDSMVEVGPMRLIDTGTSWQHFNDHLVYNPTNLYAASKQAFSDIAIYYEKAYPFHLCTLKLFDVYGPHDERRKLIPLLLNVRGTGEPLDMSPGEQILDLVHVEDVARAYLAAAELLVTQIQPRIAEYAVRSGELVSLRELVAMMERLGGRPISVRWGGRKYRAREVMKPSSMAHSIPGWRPKVSLEKGLKSIMIESDRLKRD